MVWPNMSNKRLLILGCGEAQENLIKSARELGYYIIVCDMRSGMPGERIADRYYRQDYMDKEAVYQIALKENIDGVISNSEPAMLIVSHLVDRLGLPGNSVVSIQQLLSKNLFRKLQRSMGVFSPSSFEAQSFEEVVARIEKLQYPIIMKPSESSGSRGNTRFDTYDEGAMIKVFEECKRFSRNSHVTVEEFLLMKGTDVYNADAFVVGDRIMWDGWYSGKRSQYLPMVPMTKVLPPIISEENKTRIEAVVECLLKASGVKLGEFNVETYITTKDEVFVIEINPRQAGDDIPKLIFEHSGVDFTKLLVSLSVGDTSYYEEIKKKKRECNYITLQVVFPHKTGTYEGLYIHEDLKRYVQWIHEFLKKGSHVEIARNAEDSVSYVSLRFDNRKTQLLFTNEIEKYIYPIIV